MRLVNHRDTEFTEGDYNYLSGEIIGSAIEVHKELGPGLLESTYEICLGKELELRGIKHNTQKSLPVKYKNHTLDCGYRLDLIVENKIVVEIKSVESILPVHEAQLLTYLKLGAYRLGLLINFNVSVLKNGIRRRVL